MCSGISTRCTACERCTYRGIFSIAGAPLLRTISSESWNYGAHARAPASSFSGADDELNCIRRELFCSTCFALLHTNTFSFAVRRRRFIGIRTWTDRRTDKCVQAYCGVPESMNPARWTMNGVASACRSRLIFATDFNPGGRTRKFGHQMVEPANETTVDHLVIHRGIRRVSEQAYEKKANLIL